jgi:glutamate-1-semialdehyde aminotransferase
MPHAAHDRYPQFFVSGDGCRVCSVDGRTFIDYMCSYGPVLLGHKNRAVDAAVLKQLEQGDCLTGQRADITPPLYIATTAGVAPALIMVV